MSLLTALWNHWMLLQSSPRSESNTRYCITLPSQFTEILGILRFGHPGAGLFGLLRHEKGILA